MDDVVNLTTLTDSQKRLVQVRSSPRPNGSIDEELRQMYQLSIRERLAAVQTRVQTPCSRRTCSASIKADCEEEAT